MKMIIKFLKTFEFEKDPNTNPNPTICNIDSISKKITI